MPDPDRGQGSTPATTRTGQPFDLLREVKRLRVNRFRGTWLENFPVPLPRDYVLGFDDQKFEAKDSLQRALNVRPRRTPRWGIPSILKAFAEPKLVGLLPEKALAYKIPEGLGPGGWVDLDGGPELKHRPRRVA